MKLGLGRVLLRPLLAALPLVALPVVASESESLGSIRALEIEPPSCQLQPSFSAVTTFYVVDCPEQVKQVTLNAESVFELFANGAPLKQPRIVQQLGVGTAKVLVLQACVGEATGCRHYTLDLHRAGSSEALLAELLVTSGGTDVALSPPFHPSVKLYRTDVPFASTTTSVMASAAKGGFVSFRSFSSADRHSQSVEVEVPSEGKSLGSEERPSQWKALRTLKVFVVSADWDGKMEYTLQFGRAPNADATLAAIASNVGAPYPVGEDLRRYMLEVPRGTREVALSATAVDKEGAQVTLDGQHGRGYASAVVKLNPSAPYKRLKIRVEAADEVTVLDYVLVVAMTEHSKWAMLEDLVVPGCEGGLLPKFETDVFRYRCLLNNEAQVLKVIPTVMWMPGFDQKLQISIKDKEWKSGNVFQQPLNDEGKAEVDIAVLASDRKHKAMYYVSAQGSPLKERGRLFTTLEPPPRSPPTPLPQYRFRSTTPQPQLVPQPPAPPTPQPRSTTERASISTLRPSVAPAVPMSLPLPRWPDGLPLSGIHLPIPELQLSGLLPASAADSAGVAGVLAAGGSVAALLASHELTSFMLLLKELQFLAISHQVAGDSYYALLTEPFRVFLLEIDWPGLEVCVIERWEREERGDAGDAGEGDCKTLPNEKAAEATMVWLAALPLAFLLLALGCVEATWEEQLLRKSQLRGLGLRGLRIKALPLALILLDVGLLGLTNSSKVFLPNMAVKVSIFGPGRLWISGVLSTLTLRWLCWGVALGFCGFGSAQLLRLQLSGLLCWSPKLAKFADSSTLAVTLRDSAYPRPAATAWAAMAEACDGFTELRAAVPICGPERQVLCLTDDRFSWQHKSSKRQSRKGAYEGCLFAVLPPEEALLARESIFTGSSTSRSARDLREIAKASCQEQEAGGDPHRRKLLAEGSGAAAWQLQREHLGLLIWLERRCDAYDALKVQISEATGHGVITDAEGWPIYDCQGQPLRDLYQYCIYQFPWRPWLRTLAGRNPGCSLTGAREPYRKGTGVLAPWVPSVAGVQELERQQINDWLSEWLVESEAASAAREELRQLRWCAQELQHAVLMEMALAVLERRSFRAPSGTPREAARASQRLDKLVTTPQPWQQQVDGLGSHEILAFLHEELLDSDDMPFYDEELVPDFLDASFGVLRFHVRGCGENPNPGAPPELPRRPPIRVSESLSPRRPPAARVQHAVRRLQVRENMVTVKLPLKHLEIMVRWLPSFGFAVPSKNVALPLSERWRPLFVSFGSCPKCRDCPAAAGAGTGSDNLRISSPFLALQVDSLDRLFSLLCVFLLDGEGYKGLLGLLLWPLLSALLRLRCRGSGSLGISASYAQEVTLGRRDPHWNPHSGFPAFPNMPWLPWLQLLLGLSLFLRKVTGLSKAMDVLTSLLLLYQSFLRCLLPAARLFLWKILKRRPILRGWRLHLAEEWNKQAALIVLGISSNDHPYPDYGIVQAVDKGFAGEAPNLLFVVRMLGLQLWGMQTSEVGGAPGQEAPSTNQRRLQGLRKLFILFEPCPPGLTDARPRPAPASGQGEVLDSVRQSLRFKEEIRDPIPVATTREQVVGVEELPQVVATIQVVNHLGRHWASSNRHDSFFSLFLPWGLDSRRPTATSQPRGSHDGRGQWKHWRNETFESTKLVATWQSQVLQFLDEELAAGSLVAHGILDLLFFAGNPGRGAFEEEVDKLLVPGIFTDDCLGTKRFCDSRCFREGRILHYVIASKDLKPGRRAWRPDPLAAHAASLFLSSNSSSASLPSASESDPGSLEGLNFWRPCLLRLNSRQVSYVLQKGEEEAEEAAAAAMAAGAIDHGDALEYRIPFVFLDRIEVSRGLRGHEDDECLLTFHGVASTPSSSSIATEPEAVAAGEPEECGNPLQLTPGPLRAERASPRGSPRVSPRASLPATAPSLPLVFRVGKEDGEVWAKVIEEYGMFTPPLHIFHYIGDVRDHPRLPGVVYRHGEGDQLWPDGTRYFGQWEEHVYHGTGQLQDPEGQVIYKGQWAHGMKHGEGFYRFFQEPSGSRAYSGHFQREEFSGRGILWVVEEDGSLEWVQKHRPWAITRYEGKFSGGSEVREPRSLILVDERDGVALHEYFPVLQNEAGVGPHQGPGKAPKDLAAETYGLDAADLQHCGPDADAEIWYADGTRYHGPCLLGAVPHGEGGTLWEEAGLCFEGTFDRGLRAPKGRASLPNGVIYEGDFSQPGGRRHGSGTTSIPEALQRRLGFRSYVGHYLHGLRHGQGEMIFTDGTVYRGKFEKNRRHGHGHYRTQDGTPIYTGPWKNDEPGTGYADILYPSGHRYKGKVCDGCRDGKGSLWHQDSDGDSTFLYCGHWEADEMHGEGELHCSDGVYRGQFVNGLREGKGRFEYARSKDTLSYYEGEWEEDQPQGIGTFVDEHGQEFCDREFEQGDLVGNRLTGRSKRIFSVKTISSVSLSLSKQKPSSSKVLPGPKKEIPHAGTVCQNAGLLPEEEPAQTRVIDVGSGVSNARSRPAHCGPEDSMGLRWA